MIAKFSFRGSAVPNAIVVLVPGSNGDGRRQVQDLEWTTFADKFNLLLVGCFFQDDRPTNIEDYCDVAKGSGKKLIDAIVEYCDLPGKYPKIPDIYVWGFSAGGQFAYEFACGYPLLTKGFVANKGGVYYTALASEEARRVPGVIIMGEHDADWRKDILRGIHSVNTNFGAKWNLVIEPCGHSECDSVDIGKQFFTKLIQGGIMKMK